ncbi:tetratricopeptide repeat protein [Paraflavitalea pollutisoli]|uniref:tetratricopeptide repeat protein n=1 Tax=Paraflavitalea pollutisoli TaxID=3034143 RepID=UPI0023EA80B2|nr:hypothetical protein [Paraflavitalea sp. H1-2-19X]
MAELGNMEATAAAIRAGEKVSIDDGLEVWAFAPSPQPDVERLGTQYVAMAVNAGQACLYRRAADPVSPDTRLFLIDEERIALYSFSLRELGNRAALSKKTAALREGKIKEYQPLLDEFGDCAGCRYWVANEISLAVHDERAPQAWEAVSLQLFTQLAENGDARACHELANHFYFNTSDKEAVIKWRQLAIAGGESDDLKELADFIIDEYPDRIELALDTLHTMQQYHLKEAWAWWKEGKIYTQGIGGIKADPQRGMELVQKASDLGHTVAKGDLAHYYHKGIGVAKDLHKALALYQEANEASRTFNNQYFSTDDDSDEPLEDGDYEDEIELIKKEIGKK